MSKWIFIANGFILLLIAAAVLVGQRRESIKANRLVATLLHNESGQVVGPVPFSSFATLPAPVARYSSYVRTDCKQVIKVAVMRQEGMLRTSGTTDSWHSFTAHQIVVPAAPAPGRSGLVPDCAVASVRRSVDANDRAALATLTDRGTTVSLEFRFNEIGEVTGIYSPGRFGSFDGEYKQKPWEGHFRNYEMRAGMRVPAYGEVGWYDAGAWAAV